MRYLLDTHVWLWMLLSPERLNDVTRSILADTENKALLSVASAWEAAIKQALGRLPLPGTVTDLVESTANEFEIEVLPIALSHVVSAATLPNHHRDPFDRLLVAQSQLENATLVTADESIRRYGGAILWAI